MRIAVCRVCVPRSETLEDSVLRNLTALVGFLPELHLRTDSLDAVPSKFLDDAAAFGNVRMEAEEVDAVPQWKDASLLVQFQAPAVHQHPNVLQDLLQPLFV